MGQEVPEGLCSSAAKNCEHPFVYRSALTMEECEPALSLDGVEKPFRYVLSVPFPSCGVATAIKVLYGSTCNDICRVAVRIPTPSPTAIASPKNIQYSHTEASSGTAALEEGTVAYFLKSSRGVRRGEVLLEAGGLALLQRAGLPVPRVVQAGEVDGTAYLMEPFIETGRGTVPGYHLRRDEAAAGRALARLHRCRSPDGRFGCRRVAASLNTGDVVAPPELGTCFSGDCAETPEALSAKLDRAAAAYTGLFVWSDSWADLYVEHLLQPQVTRAQQRGLWSAERHQLFECFTERLRAHFATRAAMAAEGNDEEEERQEEEEEEETTGAVAPSSSARESSASSSTSHCPPSCPGVPACSLLHGDMWGGNLMFDVDGRPLFIDPQPLYGDREMDIAMTQFFGGFGAAFYAAYEQEYPLDEDADMRVPWYQLYYLLMHLNLFGEAYGRATEEALRSV